MMRTAVLRPIGTAIAYLAIGVVGVVSARQLTVDLLPGMEYPHISITTSYEGVAPEEIETLLTRPIEQAVSTIEGVDDISGSSSEGLSRVSLRFGWGTDLAEAVADVREAVDRVRTRLPDDATTPSIYKFDLSAMPVAFLGVTGGGDPRLLKHLAEETLSRRLERVIGVAAVSVRGGRDRELRVELDAGRLASLGISVDQVGQALEKENRNVSAGDMLDTGREVVLRTTGELESAEDIANVVVAIRDGKPIHVKDIGDIRDTYRELSNELFIDGKPGIRMQVSKQSGANTVEVVDALRLEIDRLNREYDGRVELNVLWDSSSFIRSAISNVQWSALMGAALAVLVLLLFLRDIRATIVVATSIPLSVLATFSLMYFSGITLNVISFGGLALGIGLLVDASIVILESIYRRYDDGLEGTEAALAGGREVASAVFAGTMTTIAVFAPVVFVGGLAAVFFGEMAMVVSFALGCSLAVALTLVPMLAGRLLASRRRERGHTSKTNVRARTETVFTRIDEAYARLLRVSLAHPFWVLFFASALLAASVPLMRKVGFELMPETDEGQLRVNVELPIGTPIETTVRVVKKVEERITEVLEPGELSHIVSVAGPESWWRSTGRNEGSVSVMLVPVSERHRSAEEVLGAIRPALSTIPGARIRARIRSSNMLFRMMRGGEERLSVEIRGHDIATANELARRVTAAMRSIDGVTDAKPDRDPGHPERLITVDRDRAAELGLGSTEVANTVEYYVLGRIPTRMRDRGDEFDIRVQLKAEDRTHIEQLAELPVVAPDGRQVPLSSLVRVTEREGPSTIDRENQERIVRVNGGIADRPYGDIVKDLEKSLRRIEVPAGFTVAIGGEHTEQKDTFRNLAIGIVLALFLVYSVMAIQFESLRHPLVVMFSIPFAFIGVVGSLVATGTTFNMNSFLGSIVLVGLVVNNAIVLVDYANVLRREHRVPLVEAIVQAGRRRLRPILMTTLTTLLAMLPLALGAAEGSEIQAPLARVIVGGLFSSTLITLVLVPSMYLILERLHLRRRVPADESARTTAFEPSPAEGE